MRQDTTEGICCMRRRRFVNNCCRDLGTSFGGCILKMRLAKWLVILVIVSGSMPAVLVLGQQTSVSESPQARGPQGSRVFSGPRHPQPDGAKTEELNRITSAVSHGLPSVSTRPL